MEFFANQSLNMRVLTLLHKCIAMVPLGYKEALYQSESILEDWHLTQLDLKVQKKQIKEVKRKKLQTVKTNFIPIQ